MIDLFGYDLLIKGFLKGEISAKEFERKYLDKYLEDEDPINDEQFEILDELFYWVDAFTDLPMEPGDDPSQYIDEE